MPDWDPTSADVAAEIPLRVRTTSGTLANDFSADTRPTKVQVDAIIAGAVRVTVAAIGTLEDCTADNVADLRAAATDVATLRAAMRVERTFFPDQITNERSPYNAIRDELREKLATLVTAVRENCGTESGGGVAGQEPAYSFPEATPYFEAAW